MWAMINITIHDNRNIDETQLTKYKMGLLDIYTDHDHSYITMKSAIIDHAQQSQIKLRVIAKS